MKNINSKIGQRAVLLIREQIERGKDYEGKSYKYSNKPFVMPMSGKYRDKIKNNENISIFKTKAGKLWYYVGGGYEDYRATIGKDPKGDFLNSTGEMLGAMTYKATDVGVDIVFRSERASKLAYYMNYSGVGKSRRLWKFLGLTPQNEDLLAEEAALLYTEEAIKQLTQLFNNS
jgi:hypothetical protein